MQPFLGRIAALAGLTTVLLAAAGSTAEARDAGGAVTQRRVVYLNESGCSEAFERLLCNGFVRAARRTGIEGRSVTPSAREDLVDTLNLVAKQRWDLVTTFGLGFPEALAVVAPRHPRVRFALIDRSLGEVPGPRPRNVRGVVFRTSEAAFLAGYLATRMEQTRPGRDVVGIVAGFRIPPVRDFVIGFRAGARHASRRVRVLVGYANNFVDPSRCSAIARRQIAQGAGVLFNVAGACGLGTLEAARERGVWGIGVDADQSFLGPHILTSVTKDFEAGFVVLFRRLNAGRLRTGGDTVLTLSHGAVGLGKISRRVPAPLLAELERLERRIARGALRVPGAFPDPR